MAASCCCCCCWVESEGTQKIICLCTLDDHPLQMLLLLDIHNTRSVVATADVASLTHSLTRLLTLAHIFTLLTHRHMKGRRQRTDGLTELRQMRRGWRGQVESETKWTGVEELEYKEDRQRGKGGGREGQVVEGLRGTSVYRWAAYDEWDRWRERDGQRWTKDWNGQVGAFTGR